jgi:hypothetical protein
MTMNLRYAALLLAIGASQAFAQAIDPSVDQALTQEDGLTRISDGFYAKTNGPTESFVATTPAGRAAMQLKLRELRAGLPKKGGDVASDLDSLIASLGAPQPKNQEVYGDCTGPHLTGPLYAQALAGGGIGGGAYGASGQAANSTSPVINTTNFVEATVYDADGNIIAHQATTQHGATTAVASAYQTQRGCTATSLATVTCPSQGTAAITAYTYNQRQYPQVCIPN